METKKIITLREYRELINDKRFDQYLNCPVVYSHDDEGNGYDRILWEPSVMSNVEIDNDMGLTVKKAVCIN